MAQTGFRSIECNGDLSPFYRVASELPTIHELGLVGDHKGV